MLCRRGGGKRKINGLATCSLSKVYLLLTVSSYTLGFPFWSYCTDLLQGKEARCPGVASPREGTTPPFAPLKILETPTLLPLEVLSLGEPLLTAGWGHIPPVPKK